MSYELAAVMPAARLTGLFASTGTAQAPYGTVSASGAPSGTFSDVSGLVGIACMDAPAIFDSVNATESRMPAQIEAKGCRHVLLDDYYPTIEAGWRGGWRWLMDGAYFDIVGAESDSQHTQTRLELQVVTV